MSDTERNPIGSGFAFTLITFGVFIDLLQGILALIFIGELLDPAIDLLAMLGFGVMLHHHGGNALSRRSVSFTLTSIAEFIPIVDALPFWTLFAIYTVSMDAIRHREHKPTQRSSGSSWRL